MRELNYQWWPDVLNLMFQRLGCLNCALPIQISTLHFDHKVPPRREADLPRLHARNLWPIHEGENLSKGSAVLEKWLDTEQHRWAIARKWHLKAGAPGWPSHEHLGLEGLGIVVNPEPRWETPPLFPEAGF